jgi:hypothetical protein
MGIDQKGNFSAGGDGNKGSTEILVSRRTVLAGLMASTAAAPEPWPNLKMRIEAKAAELVALMREAHDMPFRAAIDHDCQLVLVSRSR